MQRTALVVEDDAAIRHLIAAALTGDGCGVVEAGDGRSALDAAASASPDVILLDIGLPDIDGLAVLRELKSDPELRSIPVVMVTAWADPDMVRQAMDRGAADYVCKPFSVPDLLARVDTVIASDEPADAAVRHLDSVLEAQATAVRRTNRSFAIVLADIDDFDALVANHGEEVGEDVLQAVAKRFRQRAGVSAVIVRHGEHGLALVLPGANAEAAAARAHDLRVALAAAPVDTPTAALRVTACFGVATHEGTEHPDETLSRAADALCTAMGAGQDAVHADASDGTLPLL